MDRVEGKRKQLTQKKQPKENLVVGYVRMDMGRIAQIYIFQQFFF